MLIKQLKDLHEEMVSGRWIVNRSLREWGGADVVVIPPVTRKIEDSLRWLYEDQIPAEVRTAIEAMLVTPRPETGLHIMHAGKQLLITKRAGELATVIELLKQYFTGIIDSFSKYEFYGLLAEAAGSVIDQREANPGIAMVEAAQQMAENLLETCSVYFAYGANTNRLTMADRCPGANALGVAILKDYTWLIHSRGYSTVMQVHGDQVYGVVWQVDAEHIQSLDRCEGVALGIYEKDLTFVEFEAEGKWTKRLAIIYVEYDGVHGEPRDGYVESIVDAAEDHQFPEKYISMLRSWLNKS